MIVYFATDHAGFEMKNELVAYVRDELGYDVVDCGAAFFDAEDDYPDFISLAAKAVSEAPQEHRAVILGGSGQGEAMCANRFPGVRAVVYYGSERDILRLSREHNDANVLSIGSRFLSVSEAKDAVRYWLTIEFSKEQRHERRIDKVG